MRNVQSHPMRAWSGAGVPLAGISTADPAACMVNCLLALNGKMGGRPVFVWDCSQGFTVGNREAESMLAQLCGQSEPDTITNPSEALLCMRKNTPPKSIVFFHNAHRFLENPTVVQGVWNLRDVYKRTQSMCVLLAPSLRLPGELVHDVMLWNEPLPDAEEIREVVISTVKDAELPELKPDVIQKCGKTLTGLSAFEAEQVTATSLTKQGVDTESLWDKKVAMIEQVKGLTVYRSRGQDGFKGIGGLENAKLELGDLVKGKLQPTCIVFIDEADKAFAASTSDSTGISQDQNKCVLTYIQDNDIQGITLLGPPGTGKTQLAKALSAEFGLIAIFVDFGEMKSRYAGDSEQAVREALKIISSVSENKALWIIACNKSDNLPPELRRRFSFLSMFVDLPTAPERIPIWEYWIKRTGLTPEQCDQVNDVGWTGAEIRNCCLKAWAKEKRLSEAAMSIVPVSRSAADIVEGLRKAASGKYISASTPGLYQYRDIMTTEASSGRKIKFD